MRKKKDDLTVGTGGFIHTGKEIIFIDSTGKKWTSENVSDIINTFKHFQKTVLFLDHYKKLL